jgi:hypothetical protein
MKFVMMLTTAAMLAAGILGFSGNAQSAAPAKKDAPAATTAPAVPAPAPVPVVKPEPPGPPRAALEVTDCAKCHPGYVQQVAEAGSKHQTEITCLECHEGKHPPGIVPGSLIPQCAKCHSDQPHFTLENCQGCHRNPHQPLNIVFGGSVKAACNTCHTEQVTEIDANPSAHAKEDCSFCHDRHRYKPDCLNCHKPHAEGQKFEECVKCHQVHNPLKLAYGTEVPNSACGACHGDVRSALESGATKHAAFQCVFCHADKHGNVPKCEGCHDAPHNAQMLSKFKGCNDCHQSAHSLLK